MDKFEIEGDEVIEREVKATGNGAHVYLPKDWIEDTVKIVRVPGKQESETCGICSRTTEDAEEWCWLDESGGAYFHICPLCRSEVGTEADDECPICRKDREMGKSDGFGPIGKSSENYAGCGTCRSRILFGNTPAAQPAWIE